RIHFYQLKTWKRQLKMRRHYSQRTVFSFCNNVTNLEKLTLCYKPMIKFHRSSWTY
ncbi:hypothetical protein L9F63_005717, partial [Diploptera punctata]